jgi:hypothetical protein
VKANVLFLEFQIFAIFIITFDNPFFNSNKPKKMIMKNFKTTFLFVFLILCFSSGNVRAQLNWDFEDDEDHGFTLRCINPATPASDDPSIAGDEAITGVGGTDGLPGAGIAWTIGPPNQFDELAPAFNEGCHVVEGKLVYNDCNDPFGAAVGDPPYDFTNSRGQSSYLNTYNLSQWGDDLHTQENDQIATSPIVLLDAGAKLTVWTLAGGGTSTAAPVLETDTDLGYVSGSSGVAVLSADDNSLLASVGTQGTNELLENEIDLSAFSGQKVIIEVVDAFSGAWGWLAVDEIQITNAALYVNDVTSISSNAPITLQNYPNPFNLSTTIEYSLTKNTQTEIAVYNLIGHKVATLVNEYKNIGTYTVTWDASELVAGVYIYQLKTDDFVESKTMKLAK